MGAVRLAVAVAVAAFVAVDAGCGTARPRAPTATARNEQVTTGVAGYDEFFAQVHALQLALNEFERARLDVLSRLGLDLGMLEGAELDAAANEVRRRATELDAQGVALNVEYDSLTDAAEAVSAAGQLGPPAQYEARVRLDLGAEGAELPPEGRRLLDALRRSLRALLGLRMRMLAASAAAPRLIARAAVLRVGVDRQVPAGQRARVRDELSAAAEFLNSARERARAEAQVAEQAIGRLASGATGR